MGGPIALITLSHFGIFLIAVFGFFSARAMEQVACSAGSFSFHADPDVMQARFKKNQFKCEGEGRTLVGIDPGTEAEDIGDSDRFVKKIVKRGCPYHIYLAGVLGPTGGSWGEYERDLCRKRNCQSATWKKSGWWAQAQKEILRYKNKFPNNQPYSIEIDNLDRATGIGRSGEGYGAFLEKFCRWRLESGVTSKLVLKNLSGEQMTKVAALIKDPQTGDLFGNCVAEFAISEYGTANINAEAAKVGINVYRSQNRNETFNYRASVRNARSCAKPAAPQGEKEPALP